MVSALLMLLQDGCLLPSHSVTLVEQNVKKPQGNIPHAPALDLLETKFRFQSEYFQVSNQFLL